MTIKQLEDIWTKMSKYEDTAKRLRERFLQEYLKKKKVPEDMRSRYELVVDDDEIIIQRDGGVRRWRGNVDEILAIEPQELN